MMDKPGSNPPAVTKAIGAAEEAWNNPPEEIAVTVTLSGDSARKYYVVSQMLQAAWGLPEIDVAALLLRGGVQRHMEGMYAAREAAMSQLKEGK